MFFAAVDPEQDDDFRADEGGLDAEVELAGGRFLISGDAVLRRAALDDVADINAVARERNSSDILVNSCPAGPTNASPSSSSTCPGPSPMSISDCGGRPVRGLCGGCSGTGRHLALRDLTLEEFPREVRHGVFTFLNHRLEERDGLQNVGMKPIQQADQHRNQHQNHRTARDNADEIAEAG